MAEFNYTQTSNKSRTGSTVFLFVMILIVVGLLAFLLLTRFNQKDKSDIVVDSTPEYIQPTASTPGRVGEFSDGLRNPNTLKKYTLDDMGTGISSTEVFNIDINGDNRPDRITRDKHENGTPHFYYEYKIELNTVNGFINITPDGFRTTEGADCALQKIQFVFAPSFSVIKISRDWNESWTTPTIATRAIYKLENNKLNRIENKQLQPVCDVADLF